MNLFQISRKMKKDAPIFIVGAPRSGTSILYKTLQKHSMFKPIAINLVESKIVYYINQSNTFNASGPWTLLNYMFNNEMEYGQFLKAIKPVRLIHKLSNNKVAIKLSKQHPLFWVANLNHIVLTAYIYYAKKARGAKRIVEKSPNNYSNIPNLIFAFPRCKLLFIHRHPIDVYTSYMRLKLNGYKIDFNADTFCHTYKYYINKIMTFKSKYGASLLIIRYEDFTQKTETEFKKICSFLRVHFEKNALIENKPNNKKSSKDPHLYSDITAKTKNWQDYISFETGKYIEDNLFPVMQKTNYHRYTTN